MHQPMMEDGHRLPSGAVVHIWLLVWNYEFGFNCGTSGVYKIDSLRHIAAHLASSFGGRLRRHAQLMLKRHPEEAP